MTNFNQHLDACTRDGSRPACKDHQGGMFDSREIHETKSDFERRRAKAIAICHTCPVFNACQAAAKDLPAYLSWGIWAGRDMNTKEAKDWAKHQRQTLKERHAA